MVNKQSSRLTVIPSLQSVQDVVINRVGETGKITDSPPDSISVLRAKFSCFWVLLQK